MYIAWNILELQFMRRISKKVLDSLYLPILIQLLEFLRIAYWRLPYLN